MEQNGVNSFKQDGNNIIMKLHIDFMEALTGFTKAIKTPDDRVHEIKKVGTTPDKEKLILKGCGLLYKENGEEKFGDLIVFCRIEPEPPGFYERISSEFLLPPPSATPDVSGIEEVEITFIGQAEHDSLEDFLDPQTSDEVEYAIYFDVK